SGDYCLTCGSDKTLKLWQPRKSLLLKTYTGHSDEVLDAKSTMDSSKLISCGADRKVILWDVTRGNVLRKYVNHFGAVNAVALNSEDSVIISGCSDTYLRIFDIRAHKSEPIE
ncbi:MAG: WD repeat-containing protein 83, partial [Paramarteilia canceri]